MLSKGDARRVEFALGYYRQLARLRRYVERHRDDAFSLRDAADAIGISPSGLSRLFAEKTGVPFGLWLRHERIRHARQILTTIDLPVTEVAFRTGFGSMRSFERAFKQSTGLTPTEFRRQAIARNGSG